MIGLHLDPQITDFVRDVTLTLASGATVFCGKSVIRVVQSKLGRARPRLRVLRRAQPEDEYSKIRDSLRSQLEAFRRERARRDRAA